MSLTAVELISVRGVAWLRSDVLYGELEVDSCMTLIDSNTYFTAHEAATR